MSKIRDTTFCLQSAHFKNHKFGPAGKKVYLTQGIEHAFDGKFFLTTVAKIPNPKMDM